MSALLQDYCESHDWIMLGPHLVDHVKEIHGLDQLPPGLDGGHLLTLCLEPIPILVAGLEVATREFYLCYTPLHSVLFVVETEHARRLKSEYRPQYGANDNYDTYHEENRTVWIYSADSPRAKDPVVANHLKPYLQ